ncbi:FUSC family protein [Desulfitobacterium sp.]|uniref:FUSC family protein n=1 Tax=Desulfitobacterium sp. TaxID=49981 RepID=UPI002B20CA05|nr:aromatic acid exporter family protein [Desulfitobacterium sp.]MEA4902080.1 aromatic acid exporter family protein [Desulfitobacterium sp.]
MPSFIGARVLKTGIGVTIALVICEALKIVPSTFAAITVVVNMLPSVNKALTDAWSQIRVHLLGVILATFLGILHWNNPFGIGVAVILIIMIANRLGWAGTVTPGIVSIIFILDAPPEQFLMHAATRSLSIFIGLGVALVTNRVLAPPRYKKLLLEKLQNLFHDSSAYFIESVRSFVQATYLKEYEKTNIVDLETRVEEILGLHEHARDEFLPEENTYLVEKLIEICQGFVERGQNIEDMTYQRVKRRLSPDSPLMFQEISPAFQNLLDILLLGDKRLEALTYQISDNLYKLHSSMISKSDDLEYWAKFDEAMATWQGEVSGVFYLRAMMEVAVVATEMRWAARRLKRIYNLGSFKKAEQKTE